MKLMTHLIAVVIFALGSAFAQENYTQWTGSKSYILNTTAAGANVAGDVVNFPVLVRLGVADSAIFTAAKTGGVDLRFTKANGTRLQHQREHWDSAGRNAAFWVLLDTVKGNSNTQLVKLRWGKADAADSSNGVAVFDTTAGFEGVWHFSDASVDTAYDATANNLKAAKGQYGTGGVYPLDSVGNIGRARQYTGSATSSGTNGSFYTVLGTNNATSPVSFAIDANYTLSTWVFMDAKGTSRSMISKGNLNYYLEQRTSGTQWEFTEFHNGVGYQQTFVPVAQSVAGSWQHLTGVRSGTSAIFYLNGVVADSTISVDAADAGSARNVNGTLIFGRNSGASDRAMRGRIDEVRIASVSRSADWVKLDFESQKAAPTLLQSIAAPSGLSYLANPANYAVNNMITPNTATVTGLVDSFTVSPALPAGLALNKTSGTISGTPTSATATAKYAVTATNSSGSVTDSVSITVTAGLPAAPTIAYTPTTGSYTEGAAINAVTPVLGGTVDSVTVAPALPAGLVLNKTTGVLSGTPTAAAAAANYVFTATNLGGSAKDTINITVAAGAEVYSTWGKHKTIWINTQANGANVAGNVLNFPVLVRFTSADTVVANSLASGGADLRFTKTGDAVRLPHEIESWDSATKTAAVWVLVDTVRGNNLSQTIRAHVGKSGVSSLSSGGSVFDTTTNYVAVWHLGGTGNISDATFNGFSGTDRGPATTATTGLAGGSRGFNGTTQYLGVPHNAKFNILQNLSVSAWINSTSWLGADGSAEGSKYVVNKGSGQNGTALWGLRDNTSGNFIFETEATANGVLSTPSDGIALNVWHHVAGTYGGGDAKLYVDGVAVNTLPATIDLRTTNDSIGIGRRGRVRDANHYFKGSIDEVRVQKVLRSADWIKLEYQSQKPAQTTVSFTQPVGIVGGAAARMSGVASLSVKGLTSGMAFRVQGVEVAANGSARLSLVDMSGRAVWSGAFATGMSNLVWNGLDNAGHAVPAGIYTAHVTVKDASGTSHVLNARVPYTH